MRLAEDRCPNCDRESDTTRALNAMMDMHAESQGFESMDDAIGKMAVFGPIWARQVRRGALGLSLALTAVGVLFMQETRRPVGLGTYIAAIALLVAVLYAASWWLLGGRNTGNPFATVRPIQLMLRRFSSPLIMPGAALLVIEVGYFAATQSRLCVCLWPSGT